MKGNCPCFWPWPITYGAHLVSWLSREQFKMTPEKSFFILLFLSLPFLFVGYIKEGGEKNNYSSITLVVGFVKSTRTALINVSTAATIYVVSAP